MCDHRRQVDCSGADQAPHLEPRLPEASSDDAVHGCALEDDVVVDVEREHFRCQSEKGRFSAWLQRRETGLERRRCPRHLEEDVDALALGSFCDNGNNVFMERIDGSVGPHRHRQTESVVGDIRGVHRTSAERLGDSYRHHTDRSGPGDEHLATGDRGDRCGMHCVPEVLLKRCNRQRHVRRIGPSVLGGNCDVLGIGAITVDTEYLRLWAEMTLAGATPRTDVADDV